MKTAEHKRLIEHNEKKKHWKRWGPFLSERQWGSVREDYSKDGDAWKYFPFEHAAARAYRWGEDGIAGISDNHQRICFAPAFWNEKDPLIKERLFGLNGVEGNHGEDIKEYYFFLDNLPTHSYMKALYKYPYDEFPYIELRNENGRRNKQQEEYELLDTGIFKDNKYFDIFIEYAKESPQELLIKITAINRGKEKKPLHILPTIWFRNTWSWDRSEKTCHMSAEEKCIQIEHSEFSTRYLYFENDPELLFTENESNFKRLFAEPNPSKYVKDAFHEYLIEKKGEAINPLKVGTKAAPHYAFQIGGNEEVVVKLRFSEVKNLDNPFENFEDIFKIRKEETEEFYTSLIPDNLEEDCRNIQRQAFASLLWSKQFYHYVVEKWLEGDDPKTPPPIERYQGRNHNWVHIYNDDILSIPDCWEYPWYASWDLAFHTLPLAILDPQFAKRQLTLLTREWYMHPNGQIPSYEWNFSDVNPPVHAWAALRVYKIEEKNWGKPDRHFLSSIFQKLLLNFTWWVNRKDAEGKNVFQGGFLGLDNISVFNRSEDLPSGGTLTQSDATSWMGMYCLNMLSIAWELAMYNSSYEDMASKFFEHFLYIAEAINFQKKRAQIPLWNEEDGFYYDVLHLPDGSHQPLKVRSMVGLIPLLAVAVMEKEMLDHMPDFKRRLQWFLENRKDLCEEVATVEKEGIQQRHLLSIVDRKRLRRILVYMLDENEFLSPYGIRSISRHHKDHPFILNFDGVEHRVDYEPGESTTNLFGGNSNWRGPIWFPLNFLLIEALQKFHHYYGDDLKVECPTGSGQYMNLWEVSSNISKRLISIFKRDKNHKRPLYGEFDLFQNDPHWKDYIEFHEYFHGESGKGIGASHQTGWTAVVAKLIQQQGEYAKECPDKS